MFNNNKLFLFIALQTMLIQGENNITACSKILATTANFVSIKVTFS